MLSGFVCTSAHFKDFTFSHLSFARSWRKKKRADPACDFVFFFVSVGSLQPNQIVWLEGWSGYCGDVDADVDVMNVGARSWGFPLPSSNYDAQRPHTVLLAYTSVDTVARGDAKQMHEVKNKHVNNFFFYVAWPVKIPFSFVHANCVGFFFLRIPGRSESWACNSVIALLQLIIVKRKTNTNNIPKKTVKRNNIFIHTFVGKLCRKNSSV